MWPGVCVCVCVWQLLKKRGVWFQEEKIGGGTTWEGLERELHNYILIKNSNAAEDVGTEYPY